MKQDIYIPGFREINNLPAACREGFVPFSNGRIL